MARVAHYTNSRDRVRAHRERLRRQGLRPIQVWVPDVSSPEFAVEAHRQSLNVATSSQEKADQEFVDAASDWEGTLSGLIDEAG